MLRLILCGKHREALDELELCVLGEAMYNILSIFSRYLPSFPYQDNPVLHTYAGLLCIFLSQSECEPQGKFLDFDLASESHLIHGM